MEFYHTKPKFEHSRTITVDFGIHWNFSRPMYRIYKKNPVFIENTGVVPTPAWYLVRNLTFFRPYRGSYGCPESPAASRASGIYSRRFHPYHQLYPQMVQQQPQVTSRGSRHSEPVTPSIAGVVTNTVMICFVIAPLPGQRNFFEIWNQSQFICHTFLSTTLLGSQFSWVYDGIPLIYVFEDLT